MARYFTGERTSYLKATDSVSVNVYPYTLSCWGKYDTGGVGGSIAGVFGRYAATTSLSFIGDALGVERTGSIRSRWQGSRAAGAVTLDSTASAGTAWHHLAVVGTSSANQKFYVDGVLVATNVTDLGVPAEMINSFGCGAFTIQSDPTPGSRTMKGAVADCAVWTSALTDSEIASLATGAQRPGDIQAGTLQAWWKLTKGGDLNSSVPYLPMVSFGTVTEVDDPPVLFQFPTQPLIGVLSNSANDYLPFSRVSYPALDDPLHRRLKATLPMTEVGAFSLSDPLNGASATIRPNVGGYWQADGGYWFTADNVIYLPGTVANPPITVSLWMKFYSTGVPWAMGIPWSNWYTSVESSGAVSAIRVYNTDFANASTITTTNVLSTTRWHHVVATFAGNTIKLYFDGKLDVQQTKVVPHAPFARFEIGGISGSTGYLSFSRDLRIWSEELQPAEIFELYKRGYARNFGPVLPQREFPALWINPQQTLHLPRLTNAAALRPIAIRGTKAHVLFSRLTGYAGIRAGIFKPEQKLQLFRLAGYAGLRTVQVKATPKVTFPRVQGAAYLRALRVKASPLFTLPRMVGYADLRALELHTFRGLWHEELATLYANQIERERRVLLGQDSMLEMFTQRGMTTELRKTLNRDFSAYHVSSLAGPEEWFLDIIETGNAWELIRELTDVCLKTHGQCLNFKILALERPVEKGHCYRMRLQAINDPRI